MNQLLHKTCYTRYQILLTCDESALCENIAILQNMMTKMILYNSIDDSSVWKKEFFDLEGRFYQKASNK